MTTTSVTVNTTAGVGVGYSLAVVTSSDSDSIHQFEDVKTSRLSPSLSQTADNFTLELEIHYNDQPLIMYHEIADLHINRDVDLDWHGCTLSTIPLKSSLLRPKNTSPQKNNITAISEASNRYQQHLLLVLLATTYHADLKFIHSAYMLDLTTVATAKFCNYVSGLAPLRAKEYKFEAIIYDTTDPWAPIELDEVDPRVKQSALISAVLRWSRHYQPMLSANVSNEYKFSDLLRQFFLRCNNVVRGTDGNTATTASNSNKKTVAINFQQYSETEHEAVLKTVGSIIDYSNGVLSLEFPCQLTAANDRSAIGEDNDIVTLRNNGVVCINEAPVPVNGGPLTVMMMSINNLFNSDNAVANGTKNNTAPKPKGAELITRLEQIKVLLSPDITLQELYMIQQAFEISQLYSYYSGGSNKFWAAKSLLDKLGVSVDTQQLPNPMINKDYDELLRILDIKAFPSHLLDAYLSVAAYLRRTKS